MKSILIVGVNGLLGSSLAEYFVGKGFSVIGVGRGKASSRLILSDYYDASDGYGGFPNHLLEKVAAVYYFAWSFHARSSKGLTTYAPGSSLYDCKVFLNWLSDRFEGPVIFSSSGGTVYGESASPLHEGSKTVPLSAYGLEKLEAERLFCSYETGRLRLFCLRISNPYGASLLPNRGIGFVDIAIASAKTSSIINVFGDGYNIRDFIHINDLCRAFFGVLNYEGPHRIFNVASGTPRSIMSVAELIKHVFSSCQIVFSEDVSLDVRINALVIDRAMSELAWRPTESLENYVSMKSLT